MVSFTEPGDKAFEQVGLSVSRPTEVEVYAVGELRKKERFDYGWIISAESRKIVWDFNYRSSDPAGGAQKNRTSKSTITLDTGNYVFYYVTDGSHSDRRWNSMPPFDPYFWGLTVRTVNPKDRKNFSTFDYEELLTKNSIVRFERVGNREFLSRGFSLARPSEVNVYAVGEGDGGKMYDYCWIVDARTHSKVWEMRYGDTEHAGGARKNRFADVTLELDKGSYVAYYITDDSHSYRKWNSTQPTYPDAWGMVIRGIGDNFRMSDVSEYDEEEDRSIIARITRVRDRANEKQSFRLDSSQEVQVYALGEGSGGDMSDFGWIEEANTGKIVWEMTYRRTDHAGGARKNRIFNDTVYLRKGEYY
ncbi:MAG: hypothetical protein KAI64_05265, partial [Thermoplasmata archaeon]|nr:hypothetical protein [Thermoplasmata archaeon]